MAALFETETCGRCGGTGHYSYNQINGTTCFGCGGGKVRLSKRGKAAQNWFHAQQTVPASEVKIGDFVYESDGFYRGWFKVVEIAGARVDLEFTIKGRTEPTRFGVQGVKSFRRRPASKVERNWQQMVALAYQATLTKEGKVRK